MGSLMQLNKFICVNLRLIDRNHLDLVLAFNSLFQIGTIQWIA